MNESHWFRAFGQVDWPKTRFSFETDVPTVTIMVDAHKVLRHTPCGVWLQDSVTHAERWVGRVNRKRWACPTEEEAIASLKRRNQIRISHLNAALKKAQAIRGGMDDAKIERLKEGCFRLAPFD